MRLIECHVENFGKLQNQTLRLDGGMNEFCRENGWGKSTWMAFIRVMLYGFQGENKRRKVSENDRRRYQPWQGGVYGGWILFETEGRRYRILRRFGEKASQDRFELRDGDTNLPSDDYSENLGEELFHINGESFQASVFIGQNDCRLGMTDGIQAKIGNLSDESEDLGAYERAVERLAEALNHYSPNRRTGAISKQKAELEQLREKVLEGRGLEQKIAEQQARVKRAGENARRALKLQQDRQASEAARRAVAMPEEQRARLALLRNKYPKGLPETAELKRVQNKLEQFSELQTARMRELDQRARDVERRVAAGSGLNGQGITSGQNAAAQGEGLPDLFRRKQSSIAVALISLGVILLICLFGSNPVKLLPGVICLVGGVVLLVRVLRDGADAEGTNRPMFDSTEYVRLSTEIYGFLGDYGYRPDESEYGKCYLELFEDAREYAELSRQEARERQYMVPSRAVSPEVNADFEDDLDEKTPEEWNQTLRTEERKLDQLREDYDALTEQTSLLQKLQEQYEEDLCRYSRLEQTREYLRRAKESLALRYRDPVLEHFRDYYGMLTGESAADFYLDTNLSLTVLRGGMSRETEMLSSGYQDLIGLCLRLAVVDAMYRGERPFLMMDDPFVNLDEAKRQAALELLETLGERYQILYFTCRKS